MARLEVDINKDSKSFTDILHDALSHDWKLIKLCVIFIVILLGIVLSIWFLLSRIYDRTNHVEIKESGAIVMTIDNNNKTASYLLSSNGNSLNTPWINTNLKFNKGDEVQFYVSGKVCIGLHRVIDAAIKDTKMPPYGWCGPNGVEDEEPYKKDEKQIKRAKFFISTIHHQGQILGIITDNNDGPPIRPNAETIINLTSYLNDGYTVEKGGFLWLTVNDVFLDDTILNEFSHTDLAMSVEEFNFIKNNHYANVWYDDNSGFFSVNMEIKH